MNETLDLTMSTDEALISALTPKQVGEIELQPFSVMRQAIAMNLCCPTQGFFNWVVTVWVCTLSPTEALKANNNVAQAQQDAFSWAETQGYSIANAEPLRAAYVRLNRELEASTRARTFEPSEDGLKNVGGRPL